VFSWGDRRQTPWRWSATAALFILFALTGCGSSDEATDRGGGGKPDSYAVAHGEAIQDCLVEVGVQFAVAPRDIAFFEDAQRAADVAEGGSAYDSVDGETVRLLVAKKGGAKEWMLWYPLPPPSSPQGPVYVVHQLHTQGAAPSRPVFVAFKVKPKFSFRKEIRRCVRFPLSPS
jgi:hypothetical protein